MKKIREKLLAKVRKQINVVWKVKNNIEKLQTEENRQQRCGK